MTESILKYQRFIEEKLAEFELPDSPKNLYEPIQYFLNIGGKRMRPVITLMACEMFNDDYSSATEAALAIELFHNFSLIHDDIMDNAPLRRNQMTIHEKWNENIGILSGDALLIESYKKLATYSPDLLVQLLPLFNDTASLVCEGQQLDMDYESADNVSIDNYLEMIQNKTAVLLACSLKMGALIGGAELNTADKLYGFGLNLGLAFQLQDDILDVYADQNKFGKQIGGDIIANKKTYLLLSAFEAASSAQKEELVRLLNETDTGAKIKGVMDLYAALNIQEKTFSKMNSYYNVAMENLNAIDFPDEKKIPLENLAKYLLNREV
ncbi:polyprenyl synthetase family protein [Crocinitomix catalasitica]|uniref:polyprenyl synthetase family protein n=1 Tax=Crocinitomix catalasitica TaxID=184607 RepID=UPI000B175186|nr:polyprenyl synthetase family protein [Crocinitomix catalasitica]